MEKNEKHIVVDKKTHKIVKLESVKEDISMGEVVRVAVVEYLERQEIERSDLTPEISKKIRSQDDNLMTFIQKKELTKK